MLPTRKFLLGFGVAWFVGLVEYGFTATAAGGPFTVLLLPVVAAVLSVIYTGCAALVGLLLRLPKLRTVWREAGPQVLWLAVPPLLILAFSGPLGLRTIDPDSRYSLMSPWLSALCYFLIVFPVVNLPTTAKAVAPPLPPIRAPATSTPSHLQYDSLEAWAEGSGLPENWMQHPNAKQRDLWWEQYAELKQRLWSQHIARLSDEEQKQFKDRTHPSSSHRFEERARPFTTALQEELARLGYTAQVKHGLYHADRLVLSAALDRTPPGGLRGVPWLFRDFEVKYHFPSTDAHQT